MQKFTEYLKKLFGSGEEKEGEGKKPLTKKMNILLLLASAGVLMILLSNFFTPQDNTDLSDVGNSPSAAEGNSGETVNTQPVSISEMENSMARQLEAVLGQIEGVGTVKVTVNLASTTEKDYAVNTSTGNKNTQEQDQGGGTRAISETNEQDQMVLVRESQGNREQPVVVMERKPEVKGVVVVADGVNDTAVKTNIMRATQVYMDIPLHKVIVLPRESR